MLDCEKLVISPPSSQASTAAHDEDVAAAHAPQHDRHHPDHHEGEEATVDVRVEEQRVDAEVVVVLVGRDDLRVQEQRLARVLDEADCRRRSRRAQPPPRGTSAAAAVPADVAEQQEQQCERHVEGERCSRRPSRGRRVQRLQRIQAHGSEQQHLHAAGATATMKAGAARAPVRGARAPGRGARRGGPPARGSRNVIVPAATTR